MKTNKILISLMILISIILCVPSIIYLITNGTVDGFNSYYTYTLEEWNNTDVGFISGVIIIGLLLIFSIIYFFVIKKEKEIFKNIKQILVVIAIISFIFMLILPFLSSDIYYYIGDSWLASKYNENPYYTPVSELQEQGINDEILDNTGYWRETTSVYGPLWNSIAKLLVSFAFGNVTIALFIFKISSYFIHILNAYLVYKISKSKKYMLIYGLNPLILIEFLSNVHNDIYLILFMLLAIYFLVRKKNIIFTILFLALSVSIKYSTVLLVPFILIYCFRNKTIPKRFIYCLISGFSIIGLVVLFYLPYYRDFTIFTNMLVQGSKYSQSLLLFLNEKLDYAVFSIINTYLIPAFVLGYIIVLIDTIFMRRITLKKLLKRYNLLMLIFIFVVLATFQKWYILWLIPTIFWQSKNMRRFIMYLTITALIPSMKYFVIGVDSWKYGMSYSIKMLIISTVLLFIDVLIRKYLNNKKIELKKEKQCHV